MKVSIESFVLGYAVGAAVVMGLTFSLSHVISDWQWKCTRSAVVKVELPREEECVEYTRR